MIFLKNDIETLNKAYRVVDIGIIGIVEVIKKVENACLEKIMLDQKKEYLIIRQEIEKLLATYGEEPKRISKMMRLSNDLYTNMQLLKNENDEEIAKMMLEGTTKGILEITSLIHSQAYDNKKITAILKDLNKVLEKNERELKKYL